MKLPPLAALCLCLLALPARAVDRVFTLDAAMRTARLNDAGLLSAEQDKIISDSYGKLATLTPDEWALIADFEEKNREALSLVRQTRSMSGVDWGLRIRGPAMSFILPPLGPQITKDRAGR